jgi:UDP-glucose-4-epimerase GalE
VNPAILVTGGAGFVGSHVCKSLARAGLRPVVYDNLSRGHRWAVQWGPLEEGDLADPGRLDQVMAAYKPIAVMHFASSIEAGASVEDPATFYANNVCNTLSLLQAMRRNGIDRIVFSSSAAVYGEPRTLPMTECHPRNPVNPYGVTKNLCEIMLSDFAEAYGLQSVALRYFNAAGADPDAEIGEAHDPETHLIPLVLEAAVRARPYISIFGDDYETSDGTCVRDYIHVSDLAEAHCLALDMTSNGPGAHAYNLGNGTGYTVREVIDTARRVTGRTIAVRVEGRRRGDPVSLLADATRARHELGWAPRRSSLEMQIADAWRWFMRHRANKHDDTSDTDTIRPFPEAGLAARVGDSRSFLVS